MTTLKNSIAEISISYRPKTTNPPQITTAEDAREHLQPFFPDDNIALYERFCMSSNQSELILRECFVF